MPGQHFKSNRLVDVGGTVQWVDGPLPRSLKSGKKWLIVEDLSAIPAEVRSIFLPLRDRDYFVNCLNGGEVIPIPANFRCICTSNEETSCRKTGLRILFDGILCLDIPDLDDKYAREMLKQHFPNCKSKNFTIAFKYWREFRDIVHKGASAKTHLSFRSLVDCLSLLEFGSGADAAVGGARKMPVYRALQIAYRNKFLPVDKDLYDVVDIKISVESTDADPTPDDAEEC